jgi:hypothetical protein
MSNLGSKSNRIKFLNYGSTKKTLSVLDRFNSYYQTHSLRDTCNHLRMSKKNALHYLSRIQKDKSQSGIKGNSLKIFTPEQKQKVISFYKHYGIDRTMSMYRLQKRNHITLITSLQKWICQLRTRPKNNK